MGFESTTLPPDLFLAAEPTCRGERTGMYAAANDPTSLALPLSILLTLAGSLMQGHANGTIHAFFVALLLLVVGVTAVSLTFLRGRAELRAFLLSFGVCVFVGGLAQQYSLYAFGMLQSTSDAATFYNEIAASPPFTTMADIHPNFNARLAVLIWQQVYAATWWLGFNFGPYTGVMFNAMLVGITGAIAVRTAREMFGNDFWRLRRVGTLFACCGIFWLFGGIFLRDAFTLFINTLILWGLVRWLCRPTLMRFFLALAITGVSCWAMWYLRQRAIVLFGLFGLLAFICWYWRERMNVIRVFAVTLVPVVILFGYVYFEQYVRTSLGYREQATETYVEAGERSSRADSLGMRLIVNQPMPIRLVMGTGSMMVYPIPLWVHLQEGAREYHLFKASYGFYQVLIMPLLLVGFLTSLRRTRRNIKKAIPYLFLLLYAMLNLMAVVATTLETRHLGQFLPAFLILTAVPDTREKKTRLAVLRMAMLWCSVVVGVHLLWWMARR